ncbi:jg5327 [Pararge aegeria aegeria]|uniref:Jg5327 protein n=1 Tax=Pararge aegeria aegeria TaxID=348720 RepID=A0A8S4R8R9_9NEOP|nr:jg5327 [Pararge aegeria aegeria]
MTFGNENVTMYNIKTESDLPTDVWWEASAAASYHPTDKDLPLSDLTIRYDVASKLIRSMVIHPNRLARYYLRLHQHLPSVYYRLLVVSPELASAALVDPQRGGQTILSASQVAAGSKRHRTVEFGTPYKRPMSSSGRLSVDLMMSMTIDYSDTLRILMQRSFNIVRVSQQFTEQCCPPVME